MFAQQRKLCFGMIEPGREAGFLPCGSGVAGVAPRFEFAFVRVAMTVGTVCKRQSCVAWLAIRAGCVTALALNCAVRACERIAGFGVVEVLAIDACGLPVGSGVTLSAVGPEAALVLVFVTCGAAR